MSNSASLAYYWDIIDAIVRSRGGKTQKYHYFEEFWHTIEDTHKNRLIILQAPTGAGKTEATLTPFLWDLINGERRWHSLLYVLPTRSLVFNMFYRICKTLNVCKQLFEVPRVVIDYDYGGFIPFKAFLEGDITVTTYDTLVYTFYGFRSYGHHLLLSVGKISGSFVILDEVQLLQDSQWYSLTLLPYHIANLVTFGATVILMTATLPRILTEEIFEALEIPTLRWNIKHPYVSVNTDPNKNVIRRGKLDVFTEDGCLLNNVSKIARDYEKPLLLVFNTVERAVEAYRSLVDSGYGNARLLHSRLVSEERKIREEFFEKNPSSPDLIVVATQVVEAGIDYDFKTIATEISPVDSLIQRLGRCARRSDGEAIVYMDWKQAEHVYPRKVIEETIKVIDTNSLAESVRNVSVASNLINSVYRKETVEELRNEELEELKRTLGFLKTFSEKIFYSRNLVEDRALGLLRLGIEIRCILLPQNIYQVVLKRLEVSKDDARINFPSNQTIDLITKNHLSLSIRKLRRDLDVPALKHKVGGGEFYLTIFSSASEKDKDEIVFKVNKYSDLFTALKSNSWRISSLFIINPSYYLVERDYHLGLVKPYG
ncbi:MAG: CRISPR-associated helicase Cas3' [Nitrososphaerota archaeon]